jgi:hypothetical protein
VALRANQHVLGKITHTAAREAVTYFPQSAKHPAIVRQYRQVRFKLAE